jgi:type IV secretion system protein VirD4
MYRLTRQIQKAGSILCVLCAGMLVFLLVRWFGCWAFVGVMLFVLSGLKHRQRFWAMGTGRWGTPKDLPPVSQGIILGKWPIKTNQGASIAAPFSSLPDKEACLRFFGPDKLVRIAPVHALCVAPSGAGKSTGQLIPFLKTSRESAVVVDIKGGELARATWRERRRFGEVMLLDPWKIVTHSPNHLNPFDAIGTDDTALDECTRLADAMVVRTGQEKEPHWNDRAIAWLSGMLGLTAWYGQRDNGSRSLLKVADLLSHSAQLKAALKVMQEEPQIWSGALARLGGQLSHSAGDELSSTLSTVGRHIRFLNTPAVVESLRTTDWNPLLLRQRVMTVYLILPAEYIRSHAGLMRLWLATLLNACMNGGAK